MWRGRWCNFRGQCGTLVGTVAGLAPSTSNCSGNTCPLRRPSRLTYDEVRSVLYFTDGTLLRAVDLSGAVPVTSTLAGADNAPGSADGSALSIARFDNPLGLTVDPVTRRVYVADVACLLGIDLRFVLPASGLSLSLHWCAARRKRPARVRPHPEHGDDDQWQHGRHFRHILRSRCVPAPRPRLVPRRVGS